jgi:hypothetical protein
MFTVLPLEIATLSLFWEMGERLGGTCTAYAMISPVTSLRSVFPVLFYGISSVMQVIRNALWLQT